MLRDLLEAGLGIGALPSFLAAVSYTHLDVYKRQFLAARAILYQGLQTYRVGHEEYPGSHWGAAAECAEGGRRRNAPRHHADILPKTPALLRGFIRPAGR